MSFDIDPKENEQGHGECAAEIQRLESQVRSLEAACGGMRAYLEDIECRCTVWAVGDQTHPADTCVRCRALSSLSDAGTAILKRLAAADRLAEAARFHRVAFPCSHPKLDDALAEYEKSKI